MKHNALQACLILIALVAVPAAQANPYVDAVSETAQAALGLPDDCRVQNPTACPTAAQAIFGEACKVRNPAGCASGTAQTLGVSDDCRIQALTACNQAVGELAGGCKRTAPEECRDFVLAQTDGCHPGDPIACRDWLRAVAGA